ncbi:unnamed protein product, partial [Discosporangium mesarthrocarpum]
GGATRRLVLPSKIEDGFRALIEQMKKRQKIGIPCGQVGSETVAEDTQMAVSSRTVEHAAVTLSVSQGGRQGTLQSLPEAAQDGAGRLSEASREDVRAGGVMAPSTSVG